MLNQNKGAGLVEILITLLIIAMGVLALARFQQGLVYNDDISQQESDAVIIATSKIESLRDYKTITDYNTIASGSETSVKNNTTYTINWTITTFASPSYKTINVSVSWPDRYGTMQTIAQETKLAGLDPVLSAGVM